MYAARWRTNGFFIRLFVADVRSTLRNVVSDDHGSSVSDQVADGNHRVGHASTTAGGFPNRVWSVRLCWSNVTGPKHGARYAQSCCFTKRTRARSALRTCSTTFFYINDNTRNVKYRVVWPAVLRFSRTVPDNSYSSPFYGKSTGVSI